MILLAIWGWIWGLPLALIGALLAPFYGCRSAVLRGGKLEVRCRRAIGHPGGQTWGQITYYLVEPDEALRRHEDTHTLQTWIFGPLLILVYPLASLVAVLRGGHYHDDNFLERWAYARSGVR